MNKLIKEERLRIHMGSKARIRAIESFSQDNMTLNVIKFYKRLLR